MGEVSPTDQEHRYPSDNGMRQAKCLQQVDRWRACLDQDGAILIQCRFAPERILLGPRVAESLQLKAPEADLVEVPYRKETGPPWPKPWELFPAFCPSHMGILPPGVQAWMSSCSDTSLYQKREGSQCFTNIWRKQRLGSRKDLNWQGGVRMGNTKGPPGRSIHSGGPSPRHDTADSTAGRWAGPPTSDTSTTSLTPCSGGVPSLPHICHSSRKGQTFITGAVKPQAFLFLLKFLSEAGCSVTQGPHTLSCWLTSHRVPSRHCRGPSPGAAE